MYGDDKDKTISRYFLKPYTYEQALTTEVRLKDLDWKTIGVNELHLWSTMGQSPTNPPADH